MKSLERFTEQFQFDPRKSLMVGVERECHLKDAAGNIVPIAERVLEHLDGNGDFCHELSACQLEWRVGPCCVAALKEELLRNESILLEAERVLGFTRSFIEIASDNMPLDVYPDPTGRYQKIVKDLSRRILLAACQIVGTHVHVGMPDVRTALRAYNSVIANIDELCSLGDHSSGRRLEIYGLMAPESIPPAYNNWEDYYNLSIEDGFVDNPRNCWHLVRISIHGTIEFRMFGGTDNLDEIVSWASLCRELCQKGE